MRTSGYERGKSLRYRSAAVLVQQIRKDKKYDFGIITSVFGTLYSVVNAVQPVHADVAAIHVRGRPNRKVQITLLLNEIPTYVPPTALV